MTRRRRALAAAVAALLAAGAGCGDGAGPPRASADSTAPATALTGTVTVFAASSLTEAFTALGDAFEDRHPGVTVSFSFAASSALARQLADGNRADVFASADQAVMEQVTDAGQAADPAVFARNRMVIVVADGNPEGIATLADLARPGTVTVLCAEQVPCGRYAADLLARAGVTVEPASREENVKGVVARVTLGEADAGLAYASDARAARGKADAVEVDLAADPDLEAVYPIAVTTGSANPEAARAFVDLVRSTKGRRTLAAFGFRAP